MTDDAAAVAAQLIQHFEGYRPSAYQDAKGVWTIGYGNTFWEDGDPITANALPISQGRANRLFLFWLDRFVAEVSELVPGALPCELAAFTSLAYNIGMQNFADSSALRVFKLGNKEVAGAKIELWNESGGVILKGLQRRRRAERLVFDGDAVADAIAQAEDDFP